MGRRNKGPGVSESAQRIYFGINFWDSFGPTFLGKDGREVAAVEATPEIDLTIGDLNMKESPVSSPALVVARILMRVIFLLMLVRWRLYCSIVDIVNIT